MAAMTVEPLNIVVFDEVTPRGEIIRQALEHHKEVAEVRTPLELSRLLDLAQSAHVAFVSVQGSWQGVSGLAVAQRLGAQRPPLAIVLIDGDPTRAYEVYRTPHCCLIPMVPALQDLFEALECARDYLHAQAERPLLLRSGVQDLVVRPSNIRYVESERRVLLVHCAHEDLRVYGKLSQIKALLPPSFCQCHQSFLVNLDMVRAFGPQGLELVDGQMVPVSQKRRSTVREALRRWVGRVL